jgi:hypothetical protein
MKCFSISRLMEGQKNGTVAGIGIVSIHWGLRSRVLPVRSIGASKVQEYL